MPAKKRARRNTRPRDTSANRARKDKDPRYQRFGKKNGSFKHGNSPHAYRRKAKAKPYEVVHHKDHNKKNSKPSNLKVLKNTKRSSAAAKHNKAHPEKGRKAAAARKRKTATRTVKRTVRRTVRRSVRRTRSRKR